MRTIGLIALATLAGTGCAASAQARTRDDAKATLLVGAAKVDITRDRASLPKSFLGINDPLFARAIALENGGRRALLVTLDLGAVTDDIWRNATAALKKEFGYRAEDIFLTATHTHSAPRDADPNLVPRIVAAVRAAIAAKQPGRVAYGAGKSYINVNRNIIDAQTRRWWEGPNADGPSDKTVAVLRFDSVKGVPIAVYYNYGVHAVLNGQLDMVSGDIPGAASRYIEESIGGKAVALWSEGAAGDQNPVYFQQTYDLRAIRVRDYARRGEDISNAMPPGGQGLDRSDPDVRRLMEQQKQMTVSMGQMLGEEVLHVLRDGLDRPEIDPDLATAQKVVTCPGRVRTDAGRAGYPGTYVDAPDPLPIRLSMLRIGDVVIGGVNGEVFSPIAMRFKAESPSKRTMMATLTNGFAPTGYIPHDAAFGQNTFEVVSSKLKPGCAERAIVDGLLDLTDATAK